MKIFYKQVIEKGKHGLDSNVIAHLIEKIIRVKNPKTRYVVSSNKLRDYYLPGLFSDRFFDRIIGKILKLYK